MSRVADSSNAQVGWQGWGSPVGLGIGVLGVGGFFTLIATGLWVLAAIG